MDQNVKIFVEQLFKDLSSMLIKTIKFFYIVFIKLLSWLKFVIAPFWQRQKSSNFQEMRDVLRASSRTVLFIFLFLLLCLALTLIFTGGALFIGLGASLLWLWWELYKKHWAESESENEIDR